MAISPRIVVNKSGVVVPVYGGEDWSKVVGQILLREAFAIYGYEGDLTSISFLGPNGTFISGILRSPSEKATTNCTQYPYGTVVINKTKYYTFIMRSTKNVYTVGNTYWGQVAGGCRVACLTSLAGQEHQWYKGINYIESTTGSWVKVTGDGEDYGFVDTGLRSGSSPTSIAMYGSW